MKDNELLFDRKSHVLYSKPCKKEILAKIALHYPEAERETVWEKVQRQYADFLSDWRTDLGGKRNFHNGVGGTYDCIAIMSYYTVCADGRSDHHRQPLHALSMQKVLHLPYFVQLADIFLPLAVNGGGGQDAEISILQIPRNRFAARSCHTHCMKEQHGRTHPVAICLKQHFYRLSFP